MEALKHDIGVIEGRLWVKTGESLGDLVRDRLDSGGYVNKLGVVHKAQEDLPRLSDALFSKRGNNDDKADLIFPRGNPRIVLFVDDLIGVHRTRSWKRLKLCNYSSRRSSLLW